MASASATGPKETKNAWIIEEEGEGCEVNANITPTGPATVVIFDFFTYGKPKEDIHITAQQFFDNEISEFAFGRHFSVFRSSLFGSPHTYNVECLEEGQGISIPITEEDA